MEPDLRPQLLGRSTRSSPRMSPSRGPRHLWDHHANPPIQASIIVYKDGTVVEGWEFESWEIANENVLVFIMGGSDYRCEPGLIHDILMANGYSCGFGANADTYLEKYTATYPIAGGASAEDVAAAQARVKAARIATLEAELAALKGT